MLMFEERRGFSYFDKFYSSSFRAGYSFDYGNYLPGFGVGYRSLQSAKNSRAVELWLPIFANLHSKSRQDDLIEINTLWVFGDVRVSPEFNFRLDHRLKDELFLSAVAGYFSEYAHPDFEFSLGLSLYF